ncbi:hypothetical protein KR084_008561 [Drosophila pseudotakahashii]|nr:hypothetical protein KR084_008561 [Drosophila pseudotakahashii]
MGASNAKPCLDEKDIEIEKEKEAKALRKFMRTYKKNHADMDRKELKRSGQDAWGKLMPHEKKKFEVKPRAPAKKKSTTEMKKPVVSKRKKPVCGMLNSPAERAIATVPIATQAKKTPKKRAKKEPPMDNTFLNFCRFHKMRNEDLDVDKRLQKAAKAWSQLSVRQREKFRPVGEKKKIQKKKKSSTNMDK